MRIYSDLADAVGKTPLIRLNKASELTGCEILGKAEFLNPGQSVKDRAALYIIRDAVAKGKLRPGGTIAVADHDATTSTFGRWFMAAYPDYDPVGVQRFWDRHGFFTEPLTVTWTFDSRADLAAVLAIELPPAIARRALAEHVGLTPHFGPGPRPGPFFSAASGAPKPDGRPALSGFVLALTRGLPFPPATGAQSPRSELK